MELAGIAVDPVDVFELADRLIQAGHPNTAVLLHPPASPVTELNST